jgi:hypothetical protein
MRSLTPLIPLTFGIDVSFRVLPPIQYTKRATVLQRKSDK